MISRREVIVGALASFVLPKLEICLTAYGAEPGADSLPAFKAALAALEKNGGGTLVVPSSVNEWVVNDTVFIRNSNIFIKLFANVKIESKRKSSVFVFEGKGPEGRIKNVGIVGMSGMRRIDGNGRSVAGYDYSTSDTYYSCVLFKWCENWTAESIYGYNGLVNCLRAFKCGTGRMINCSSSHSVYDNGQSLDFCSGENSRIQIRNAKSWMCAACGVTSYASKKVDIIDAYIHSCGNDNPNSPVSGGGLSVEGDYFKDVREVVYYDVNVLRPKIYKCINAGLIVTAPGVTLIEPLVVGTRRPVHRLNPMQEKGANLYCLAACDLSVVRGILKDAGGSGVFMLGNNGYRPRLAFDGIVSGSRAYGIRARKADFPRVTKRSRVINSFLKDRLVDIF